MKLQEMISETLVDFYKEIETDVRKDTGESIFPITYDDVERLIESEISSLIQKISEKDYYTDKPLIETNLITPYIVEESLLRAFRRLDFETLADKVNKEFK